jgi:signal recognition particle receptor subunit beta
MRNHLLPIGFDDDEIRVIEALLVLGGARLKQTWELGRKTDRSVLLVKVGRTEESLAHWQALARDIGLRRLIAYVPSGVEIAAERRILQRDGQPLGMRELVEALNASGNEPGRSPPAEPETNAGRFDPEQHFLALLDAACRQDRDTLWEYQGITVYVRPGDRAYFAEKPLENLLPLLSAPRPEIAAWSGSEAEARIEGRAAGWRRGDLLELLWFAALVASQGRPHVDFSPEEPLSLKVWPEFVRLPYYREYLDIANHMATRADSIGKIAEATRHPTAEVADFVNACRALDLVLRGREALARVERQHAAKERIRHLCLTYRGWSTGTRPKLVFAGSIGAGKTTAISALSDGPIVLTEAKPSDDTRSRKSTTTVAMDYGSMALGGTHIQLYGTPGQKRFDFMGQILAPQAWGIVVFVNNREEDPLSDLRYYLKQYRNFADKARMVVAVTHHDSTPKPDVPDYQKVVQDENLDLPVVVSDPRNLSGLVEVFEALFEQAPVPSALS